MVSPGGENTFSSYKSSAPTSTANLFIVAPLTKDRDVFQVTRDITAFVQTLQRNDQTHVSFGATSLGIEDPERFREQLLPLIQEDIKQVRSALGNAKSFEVSSLESPVAVLQKDDKNIIVFIPYKLKVGQ